MQHQAFLIICQHIPNANNSNIYSCKSTISEKKSHNILPTNILFSNIFKVHNTLINWFWLYNLMHKINYYCDIFTGSTSVPICDLGENWCMLSLRSFDQSGAEYSRNSLAYWVYPAAE